MGFLVFFPFIPHLGLCLGFFWNFSIFFILHTFGRFLQMAALTYCEPSNLEIAMISPTLRQSIYQCQKHWLPFSYALHLQDNRVTATLFPTDNGIRILQCSFSGDSKQLNSWYIAVNWVQRFEIAEINSNIGESNSPSELLPSAAVGNLFTRCQRVVRKPIRYVTIHFQDRSGAASLRCKNRAEISDSFVNRSPIRYGFCVGAQAIRYNVDIAFVSGRRVKTLQTNIQLLFRHLC